MPAAMPRLLPRITCPHCWAGFPPENVLWIAAHPDLIGDPKLGTEQARRFLPSRFNVEGNALDARRAVCNSLACPNCHLSIPRALLEIQPLFVSILGTPACGKSYFLAAMTWQLRRELKIRFGVAFTDADTTANRNLNEYEESLFLNSQADEWIALATLIRKTQPQGDLYDSVAYGNQAVSYPRPFLFAMQPETNHPNYQHSDRLSRVLCLYDNAGEHFLVGQDSAAHPVTQHLAHSRLLLFLFDPTQDQRFRKLGQEKCLGDWTMTSGRNDRQEIVLQEAAVRVRRHTGLAQTAKYSRPLIVVLTKCDAWGELLEDQRIEEPWVPHKDLFALDLDRIESLSAALRALLLRVCPEVVAAAESFAEHVVYVAASALGRSPAPHPVNGVKSIRPSEIQPKGVTTGLLYGLCGTLRGLIPAVRREKPERDGARAGKSKAASGRSRSD
jgi:hypothetical protein